MTPHRPRPLCAICADREATTATDWELRGVMREVPACEVCLAPVPDPIEVPDDLAECMRPADVARRTSNTNGDTRAAVIAAVRRLGTATRRQVVAELGAADNVALTHLIRQHLRRLEVCGAMTFDREADPGVYRLTDSIATTRAAAATLGVFEALPEEFDTFAIDPDHKRAAVIVRAWRREGLVSCVRAKRDSTVGGQRVWFAALWRKTEQARRAA